MKMIKHTIIAFIWLCVAFVGYAVYYTWNALDEENKEYRNKQEVVQQKTPIKAKAKPSSYVLPNCKVLQILTKGGEVYVITDRKKFWVQDLDALVGVENGSYYNMRYRQSTFTRDLILLQAEHCRDGKATPKTQINIEMQDSSQLIINR